MRWRLGAILLCLLCLLPTMILPARAATPEQIWQDLLDALPRLDGAPDDAAWEDPTQVRELVGVERLFSLLTQAGEESLPAALRQFCRLVALLLLAAACRQLCAAHTGGEMQAAVGWGITLVLACLLYREVAADVTNVTQVLADMRTLSQATGGAFGALLLAGGSAGTAASAAAGFAAYALLLEEAGTGCLPTLLRALFALTLIGTLGRGRRGEGLMRTTKNIYLTLLSLLSLGLTASLAFQTSLSAAADSLSARSISFALGQMIPVVGGAVGSTVRTLSASLALIQSAIGALGVFYLLSLLLPPLLSLLLHRLCLSLCASVADLLGCAEERALLQSFRSLYDLAIAALAITSVLFILLLALLLHCTPAIGQAT